MSIDTTWKAMVNDVPKLHAAVDAMAQCMGKVLSLKNAALDGDPITRTGGRQPLGLVLYEEKEHFPTREQLDQIDEIHEALKFVEEAHGVAAKVCADSDALPNVVLSHYATTPSFCKSWTFTRPNSGSGDGSEGTSKLYVGGLRRLIFSTLVRMVEQWLLACDEAMMVEFSDMPKGERVDESPLYSLARNLAESIARRLSTFEPSRAGDVAGDDLSTRVLEERANEEVARMAMHAEESQRSDLVALRSLEILAKHGPEREEGKAILTQKMHHLRHIVQKRPIELGLTGVNASHMNLQLLARACEPEIDSEVRSGIARQWFMRHGGCATTAAQQAIQKIRCSKPQQPFTQVLQFLDDEKNAKRGKELPAMPFAREPHKWYFVVQQERRTSLDWLGRRILRMTSLIVQLLGQGSLERGIVASTIIEPIATQAVLEARVVYGLLKVKLDSYAIGTKLLCFCEDVANAESHLSNDISDAMLPLCRFSTIELMSLFSPQSPALRVIMDEFTARTRKHLTFHMPAQYVAFAYDTLAVLLPTIRARRERAGVGVLQTTTPIQQLLRRLPQVHAWSPINGSLKLEQDELKNQPRIFVELLKELARRKVLVQYKRPYVGKQRHAAKMAFVFDSAQLIEALSGCAIRPPAAAAAVRAS